MHVLVFAGFDLECVHPAVWKGGETEALARLVRHLERKVRIRLGMVETKLPYTPKEFLCPRFAIGT